jgi:tetratricopeptide (TPR) repeat protein
VNHFRRSLALLFTLILLLGLAAAQTKQQPSGRAAELLRTALELYQQGKHDEAFTKCKQSIALDPKEYRAHVLLGYIYGAQQKLDLASQSFATAIRLEPKDKEVYLLKAQVDFFRNKQGEALVAAQKAVALDPKYGEAQLMVGALLKTEPKRRTEAIAALRAAIDINPQLVAAYDDLGDVLLEAKQPKDAEAVYRQGMLADPKKMAGRFALGRMLVAQGRLPEAREVWEGRTSDEDRVMPSFIDLLKRAENMKRAREAIVANPNDPDALVDMGLAVMDGDHWVVDDRQKRAIVLFRKALEVKPDHARAQQAIVKAYIQLADNDSNENTNVDRELARLRKLDPKLAAEMEQYRKEYVGGFVTKIKP